LDTPVRKRALKVEVLDIVHIVSIGGYLFVGVVCVLVCARAHARLVYNVEEEVVVEEDEAFLASENA
jgi:hypothetical protein